jgi:hypothetical protein
VTVKATPDVGLGADPHTFTGGTIRRVVVDASGGLCIDLEGEAQPMRARE